MDVDYLHLNRGDILLNSEFVKNHCIYYQGLLKLSEYIWKYFAIISKYTIDINF